jgi:hypothetical protein
MKASVSRMFLSERAHRMACGWQDGFSVHHSGPRDKDVKGRSRIEKRKRVEPHGRPITLAVLVVTRCLY